MTSTIASVLVRKSVKGSISLVIVRSVIYVKNSNWSVRVRTTVILEPQKADRLKQINCKYLQKKFLMTSSLCHCSWTGIFEKTSCWHSTSNKCHLHHNHHHYHIKVHDLKSSNKQYLFAFWDVCIKINNHSWIFTSSNYIHVLYISGVKLLLGLNKKYRDMLPLSPNWEWNVP